MSKIIFDVRQRYLFFFLWLPCKYTAKLLHPSQGLVLPSCFMLLFRIRVIVNLHFWNFPFANLSLEFYHNNFYFQYKHGVKASPVQQVRHLNSPARKGTWDLFLPSLLGQSPARTLNWMQISFNCFKGFVFFIQTQHFKMQILAADESVQLRSFLFFVQNMTLKMFPYCFNSSRLIDALQKRVPIKI